MKRLIIPMGLRRFYRGPEEDAAAAAAKAAADAATAKNQGGGGDDRFKQLNFNNDQQEFVNKLLAEERKSAKAATDKTIAELQKVQADKSTTETQRKALQTQIDELKAQHMSREDILKAEKESVQREMHTQLEVQKKESETWQNRFTKTTIKRELGDGASEAGAYSNKQIVAILEPNSKLVEERDSQGNPTGNFVTMVTMEGQNAEGKPAMLEYTVKDAIQKLKNNPQEHGNLFKSILASGLGGSGSAANGSGRGGKQPKDMSQAEYNEWRKKNPNADPSKVE